MIILLIIWWHDILTICYHLRMSQFILATTYIMWNPMDIPFVAYQEVVIRKKRNAKYCDSHSKESRKRTWLEANAERWKRNVLVSIIYRAEPITSDEVMGMRRAFLSVYAPCAPSLRLYWCWMTACFQYAADICFMLCFRRKFSFRILYWLESIG